MKNFDTEIFQRLENSFIQLVRIMGESGFPYNILQQPNRPGLLLVQSGIKIIFAYNHSHIIFNLLHISHELFICFVDNFWW